MSANVLEHQIGVFKNASAPAGSESVRRARAAVQDGYRVMNEYLGEIKRPPVPEGAPKTDALSPAPPKAAGGGKAVFSPLANTAKSLGTTVGKAILKGTGGGALSAGLELYLERDKLGWNPRGYYKVGATIVRSAAAGTAGGLAAAGVGLVGVPTTGPIGFFAAGGAGLGTYAATDHVLSKLQNEVEKILFDPVYQMEYNKGSNSKDNVILGPTF